MNGVTNVIMLCTKSVGRNVGSMIQFCADPTITNVGREDDEAKTSSVAYVCLLSFGLARYVFRFLVT